LDRNVFDVEGGDGGVGEGVGGEELWGRLVGEWFWVREGSGPLALFFRRSSLCRPTTSVRRRR
jgi:hypothetical protein